LLKRFSLLMPVLLLLAVSCCSVSWAADTELQAGKAHDGALTAPKTNSYSLTLRAGDLAETNVVTHGSKLIVTVYGPSGSKVRGFRLDGPGQKIQFIADDPGGYRLEVALDPTTTEGSYTITLTRIIALSDRMAPVGAPFESPQIKALKTALDQGQASAVEAFWRDVKAKGAPLVEPLEDNDKEMLVTFLWRGDANTKNVRIMWFPFALQEPDDYRLIELGETNVWYRSLPVDKRKRFIYQLAVNVPALHPSVKPSDETAMFAFAGAQVDPLNPKHWLVDPLDPDVPGHLGTSAVEMPGAPPQPWIAQRKDVPIGKVEKYQFKSALLKNEREVAVYTPAGYSSDAKPYGLIVLFDEKPYLIDKIVPTPTILDNLIAENRIPRMVAVFIDNPPGDARARELPCNPTFADFLNFELVPWVRRLFNVTSDPQQTVVGGSSYGGLAAAYAGLRHPETFGSILSQSGSYWWTPPRSDNPSDFDLNAEPNWLANQYIMSPRLPLRFYMDAGSDEFDPSGHGSGILEPSRHMRDVLLAKGYEVHYQEFQGGHDYLSWRGTLADGLIVLMGGSAESRQRGNAVSK
jgi:enterochelin esterase-like enzyme